ncbi:hypothetical protein [Streptomonospora wellingtoniae]|uniref:Uncharacterized protein n=1 Tax=Streptomonospora wellingtoniae TaxID=3075544 RepID=A0ABU2L0K5_9ACTN|nr:hypothetical protein [Streptomonospora sp. DSM 45055]MDT0305090.1 hypothetical protein [Streptomonospora sp. DSM 45055]
MTAPTDMNRDQVAAELYRVHAMTHDLPAPWDQVPDNVRDRFLQVADGLLARTVVLARTRTGPADAADYLTASTVEAVDQATEHAADSLRRARELGVASYYQTSVTADESTLVQMIVQAWISGHRTASAAASGVLDDLAAARTDADRATTALEAVQASVADMNTRTEQGLTITVEVPGEVPVPGRAPLPDSYTADIYAHHLGGKVRLVDLNDGERIADLDYDTVRALVPYLLALVRDHDQAPATKRDRAIRQFAERAHVELCGGTAEAAAGCDHCQDFAAFAVDRFAAQADADAA